MTEELRYGNGLLAERMEEVMKGANTRNPWYYQRQVRLIERNEDRIMRYFLENGTLNGLKIPYLWKKTMDSISDVLTEGVVVARKRMFKKTQDSIGEVLIVEPKPARFLSVQPGWNGNIKPY